MRDVYEELLRLERAGTPAALAIVTAVRGSTPQVVGAKMVVHPDGRIVGTVGGGRFEKEVMEVALSVIAEGQPRVVSLDLTRDLGMACGGHMDAFVEPVRPIDRLVAFGGGHVAGATAALARTVGFAVTVVDPRPQWANAERIPGCEVVNVAYDEAPGAVTLTPRDHVLVMTHGHAHDRAILDGVLRGPQSWTGAIGSRRKVAKTRALLLEAGHEEEAVAAISSPVGLDIGAESPEEIAVSIVAELIRHRHG